MVSDTSMNYASAINTIPYECITVDKDTIHENKQLILDCARKCCFWSLDFEFSGLGDTRKLSAHDVDSRYSAMCTLARQYSILEVGLAFFGGDDLPSLTPTEMKESSVFESNKTLNMNEINLKQNAASSKTPPSRCLCFRIPVHRRGHFTSNTSALQFLVEHGFNFNEAFEKGLYYTPTPSSANRWKFPKVSNEDSSSDKKTDTENTSTDDLDGGCSSNDATETSTEQSNEHTSSQTHVVVVMRDEILSPLVRLLRSILIETHSKPFAIHNGWLDLVHLYAMVIGPPPTKLSEWVNSIREYFPCILDAKFVATSTWRNVNTSLSALYETQCCGVFDANSPQATGQQNGIGYILGQLRSTSKRQRLNDNETSKNNDNQEQCIHSPSCQNEESSKHDENSNLSSSTELQNTASHSTISSQETNHSNDEINNNVSTQSHQVNTNHQSASKPSHGAHCASFDAYMTGCVLTAAIHHLAQHSKMTSSANQTPIPFRDTLTELVTFSSTAFIVPTNIVSDTKDLNKNTNIDTTSDIDTTNDINTARDIDATRDIDTNMNIKSDSSKTKKLPTAVVDATLFVLSSLTNKIYLARKEIPLLLVPRYEY